MTRKPQNIHCGDVDCNYWDHQNQWCTRVGDCVFAEEEDST